MSVKEMVAGSNPASGAPIIKTPSMGVFDLG